MRVPEFLRSEFEVTELLSWFSAWADTGSHRLRGNGIFPLNYERSQLHRIWMLSVLEVGLIYFQISIIKKNVQWRIQKFQNRGARS